MPGGRPAAAIAGGILAGFLLGPAVLGPIAPTQSEVLFDGGRSEHKALLAKDLEHTTARLALTEIGPSPEAMTELLARQGADRAPLLARFEAARARTHFLTGSVMVGLVSLALGAAAWGGRAGKDGQEEGLGAQTILGMAVIAGCIVLFAAVPTVLLVQWLHESPLKEMIAIGGVIAAGSLFAPLPLRWMRRAGRDGFIRLLGLLIAMGAAGLLAWAIPPQRLAFLLVPAAAVGIGSSLNLVTGGGHRARRCARRIVLWVCIPACAAYLTREIDTAALLESWRPMTLIAIAAATAGAGHFIGSYLAIQTFGHDETRSKAAQHSIEFLASGVGLTQVCLTVVFFAALPEAGAPVVLAMLLTNALAIEIQAPLNRRAISSWLE